MKYFEVDGGPLWNPLYQDRERERERNTLGICEFHQSFFKTN